MRAAWESPKRTPVGEERLEADRRAVVAKIAKMEKAAKRVAAKEALRLESQASEVVVQGRATGCRAGQRLSMRDARTATSWAKGRPGSAGTARMPGSMRAALRRGTTKESPPIGSERRDFAETVARPSYRAAAPPQPGPDESGLKSLLERQAVRGMLETDRRNERRAHEEPGGPASPARSSPPRSGRSGSPALSEREQLHFSPHRRRNPGASASPTGTPWPLHRVAVAAAVAESLAERPEISDVLHSRSTSLKEWRERNEEELPRPGVEYLEEHDAGYDERAMGWRRRVSLLLAGLGAVSLSLTKAISASRTSDRACPRRRTPSASASCSPTASPARASTCRPAWPSMSDMRRRTRRSTSGTRSTC